MSPSCPSARHGEAFLTVKERTSVLPFQAILQGRQELPPDYYKAHTPPPPPRPPTFFRAVRRRRSVSAPPPSWQELVRAPYALIAAGTLGAYAAHPYMQAGAALVRNTGLVPGGCLDGLFS